MVRSFQSDSSLLDIATQFRKLKNNCTAGSDITSHEFGEKIILINEIPPIHPVKLDYWKKVKAKFSGNYLEVKHSTILESVKSKDPRYIYVHGYNTYNAEDGSVIYIL
ncbi:MAG: hypothetical protein HRT61_15875 [Ekhidna sp.]|nr:hypothetical protein [Ekhidna sp.]